MITIAINTFWGGFFSCLALQFVALVAVTAAKITGNRHSQGREVVALRRYADSAYAYHAPSYNSPTESNVAVLP